MQKNIPPNYHIDNDILDKQRILQIAQKEQTPLYIYDKKVIAKYLNYIKK